MACNSLALTRKAYTNFSQKQCMAEDDKSNKTLMTDLHRQSQHPMVVVSANAVNCYDKGNHIIIARLASSDQPYGI